MTQAEAITVVKTLLENDPAATDALVGIYLDDAKAAILRRLYPFGSIQYADIPDIYEMLWCKLAVRYFLRRGAEGEYIHDENGINRHYSSPNDEDLLKEVTPYVWVAGGAS